VARVTIDVNFPICLGRPHLLPKCRQLVERCDGVGISVQNQNFRADGVALRGQRSTEKAVQGDYTSTGAAARANSEHTQNSESILRRARLSPFYASGHSLWVWWSTVGSVAFVRTAEVGRLDAVVVVASLRPGVTVILASTVLKECLTQRRTAGICLALLALMLIAS
jgi:hypothetical protein